MWIEQQTQFSVSKQPYLFAALLYSYGVADRVDFSSLSNVRPQSVSVDMSTFLLNSTDLAKIKQIFISRYNAPKI